MSNFLVRWATTAVAIGVAAEILPGIRVNGVWAAVVAALLLGLANATLRPLLLLLTLPITVVTLGLFALVVNGAMLALVASVVKGVHVGGFWSAVLGALVISMVGGLLNWVIQPHPRSRVHIRIWRPRDEP
jgi:putative membrane protein